MHIIPELAVGGGSVGLFAGGGFQLHDHQRQPVHKQDHIGALFGVLNERPLVCHRKIIVVRVCVVHQINQRAALLPVFQVFHRDTVLQIIRKGDVLLQGRPALEIFEFVNGFVDCILRKIAVDPL